MTGNKNIPPPPNTHTHNKPNSTQLCGSGQLRAASSSRTKIAFLAPSLKKMSEHSWMPKIKTDQIKGLNAIKQLLHYNNLCLTHTPNLHTHTARLRWSVVLHAITPLKRDSELLRQHPDYKTQGTDLHVFLCADLGGPACACRESPAK